MLTVDAIKYFTDLGEKAYELYKKELGISSENDMMYHIVDKRETARAAVRTFVVETIKTDDCVKITCRNNCGADGKNYTGNDALDLISFPIGEMFCGHEQSEYDPGTAIVRLLASLNYNFNISIER